MLSERYIGGFEKNLSDAELHLVFLFATPLVISKGHGGKAESFKDKYKA